MLIASVILQLTVLLLLMKELSFARIIPRQNKPIELDVTNQGYVGDYFFHFYLEEDTLPGRRSLSRLYSRNQVPAGSRLLLRGSMHSTIDEPRHEGPSMHRNERLYAATQH